MSNDELLAFIDEHISWHKDTYTETYAEYITRCTCQEKKYPCDGKKAWVSLRAVVELHKPEYWENIHDPNWNGNECSVCFTDGNLEIPSARIDYPCPTIQAIEKELG